MSASYDLEVAVPGTDMPGGDGPSFRRILVPVRSPGESAEALAAASRICNSTINGVLRALTTTYTYDANNRLASITDPLGEVSHIEYDSLGHMRARVDALTRRTTYDYDPAGRLVQAHGANDVDRGIERRIIHRTAHGDLSGEVEDHLWPGIGEQSDQVGADDVGLRRFELGAFDTRGLVVMEVIGDAMGFEPGARLFHGVAILDAVDRDRHGVP